MRNLIAMVCGLLLLVSAAAATGSNNNVNAIATLDTTGTCIVGANVVQSTVLDSFLLGCDNDIDQNMFLSAEDNSLVGLFGEENGEGDEGADMTNEGGEGGEAGEGEEEEFTGMNFLQSGKMVVNAIGSGAVDFQDIDIIADDNCQTMGNFTQFASQKADDIGCNNNIFQDSDVYAGAIDEILESEGNSIVRSDVTQAQILDACATGDNNDVDQHTEQDLFDSCLTNSRFVQEAMTTQNVMGCGNSNDLELGLGETELGQSVLQVGDDSSFVDSTARQAVVLNEQATGSDNLVAQFGETVIDDDCMTLSTAVQSVSETFVSLGCDNVADQDAILENMGNSLVGGTLSQQSVINTNA